MRERERERGTFGSRYQKQTCGDKKISHYKHKAC